MIILVAAALAISSRRLPGIDQSQLDSRSKIQREVAGLRESCAIYLAGTEDRP